MSNSFGSRGYQPTQSHLDEIDMVGTQFGLQIYWLDKNSVTVAYDREQYTDGQASGSQSQSTSPYLDTTNGYTQTRQGLHRAECGVSPDTTISPPTQTSEHGRVPAQQVGDYQAQTLAPSYHTGSQQSFPSQTPLTTHGAVDDLDYKLQCVGQMKEWTRQLVAAVRLYNDTETTLPLGLETYIRPIAIQIHGERREMSNPDQASLDAWDQRTQQTCERVVEGYQKWIDTGSWPVDLDLQTPS